VPFWPELPGARQRQLGIRTRFLFVEDRQGYGRRMSGDADLELAKTFSEIARILIAETDPQATLQRIVSLAVKTIESCEHAGISVVEGTTVTSPASSDEVPAIVDRIQSETGEGPCVDAIREHQVFQTGKLSEERRWPVFTPRAIAESGIESVLSLRLFADKTMGALNLYSTQMDAFDDRDVAVATVFAAHAAVAWSTSQTIENLKVGLVTRQLIGQAVGLLMVRQNMSESDALEALKRASQRLNIKLRQVAERIVYPEGGPPTHSVD
jgi:GAF domain-containing protein